MAPHRRGPDLLVNLSTQVRSYRNTRGESWSVWSLPFPSRAMAGG
jgi:hypothetical protein